MLFSLFECLESFVLCLWRHQHARCLFDRFQQGIPEREPFLLCYSTEVNSRFCISKGQGMVGLFNGRVIAFCVLKCICVLRLDRRVKIVTQARMRANIIALSVLICRQKPKQEFTNNRMKDDMFSVHRFRKSKLAIAIPSLTCLDIIWKLEDSSQRCHIECSCSCTENEIVLFTFWELAQKEVEQVVPNVFMFMLTPDLWRHIRIFKLLRCERLSACFTLKHCCSC